MLKKMGRGVGPLVMSYASCVVTMVTVGDRPLVVQFAANNAKDFADAAELVAP